MGRRTEGGRVSRTSADFHATPPAGAEAWRLSRLPDEFLATASVDEALSALAELQHLVFHLAHLEAIGLTRAAVWSRCEHARLHRVHHAVYSLVPPSALSLDGRRLAAVLACGPTAALGWRDAGSLHELRPNGRANFEVVVPGRSHRNHPGIDVHRSVTVTAADITVVRNIPVTTVARAILDMADVLRQRELDRVLEQAEVLGVFDLVALHDQIARNPTRRGAHQLADTLGRWEVDFGQLWSDFEEALDGALRLVGLPRPRRQHWIDPGDGLAAVRADLAWPALQLAVQPDGWRFHRARAAFERNTRDDQRLLVTGWLPVRCTWWQLRDDRERLISTIARLVNDRSGHGCDERGAGRLEAA